LGLVEALLAEPRGDGEGAGAVMAEHEDGRVFVELLVGAGGDVVHGEESAAFDVGGGVLPGLTDVEEEGRVFGGECSFELVDGDFEIHGLKNTGARDGVAVEYGDRAEDGVGISG
jgi:hypothetical protein